MSIKPELWPETPPTNPSHGSVYLIRDAVAGDDPVIAINAVQFDTKYKAGQLTIWSMAVGSGLTLKDYEGVQWGPCVFEHGGEA